MSISPTTKMQDMTTGYGIEGSNGHVIKGLGAVGVVHKKINHHGDKHTETRYAQAGEMVQITKAVQSKKMEDQAKKITAIAQEIVRSDDKEECQTLKDALMVQSRILAKLEMGAMTITDKLEERALKISTNATAHAKKMADQTKKIEAIAEKIALLDENADDVDDVNHPLSNDLLLQSMRLAIFELGKATDKQSLHERAIKIGGEAVCRAQRRLSGAI
jgi:hypothetical protein